MLTTLGDHRIVLASRSPRRAELLRQLGLRFEVRSADLDETPRPAESAHDYVARLAQAKARAVRNALEDERPVPLVIGADTAVVVDGGILGKPADPDEARAMLEALAGRSHHVLTGVAVCGAAEVAAVSDTQVWFKALSDAELGTYLATDEPWDKAGAYAIQGRAACFVSRIEGSYSGVVGLPLFETCSLLRQAADIDARGED